MKRFGLPERTDAQRDELNQLYRITKDPRLRTRAPMVLLAGEQAQSVPEVARIVREVETTVLRWLKRYQAEGVEGLKDAPRPGRPATVPDS